MNELLHFGKSDFRNSVKANFTSMPLSYHVRHVYRDTKLSPYPPSGQHHFCFLSPGLPLPPYKRQRLSGSLEYQDTLRVSLWWVKLQGPAGWASWSVVHWRNRKYSPTGLSFSLTASAACSLDACCSAGIIFCDEANKQNENTVVV